MRQMMIGLSAAIHSNRILIWGVNLPMMFRETSIGVNVFNVLVRGVNIDCSDASLSDGGSYNCFFESLSSCSLSNSASPEELVALSRSAYNASARIAVSEDRKSLAMYHPPFGMFSAILDKLKLRLRAQGQNAFNAVTSDQHLRRQIWAAAISAYVFRLRADIVSQFWSLHSSIFPSRYSRVWGLHVRHGDVRSQRAVYAYKPVFSFEQYFQAARSASREQGLAPHALYVATDSIMADSVAQRYRDSSSTVRKYRDSTVRKVDARPGQQLDLDEDGDDEGDDDDDDDDKYIAARRAKGIGMYFAKTEALVVNEEQVQYKGSNIINDGVEIEDINAYDDYWFGYTVPNISIIDNSIRYRNEHGSHTVAADGACTFDEKLAEQGLQICAIDMEAMAIYKATERHRSVPRPTRLMLALLEAIEDLYILSLCDTLIGTGTSYYSTMASLLIWARTGAVNASNTAVFLDSEGMTSGTLPNAYLNNYHQLEPSANLVTDTSVKWKQYTDEFISGIETRYEADLRLGLVTSASLAFNPWAPGLLVKVVRGLPYLPAKVFYREAQLWLGLGTQPSWPGDCAALEMHALRLDIKEDRDKDKEGLVEERRKIVYNNMNDGFAFLQGVADVLNAGSEHGRIYHHGQSIDCWSRALDLLKAEHAQLSEYSKLSHRPKHSLHRELSSEARETVAKFEGLPSLDLFTAQVERLTDFSFRKLEAVRKSFAVYLHVALSTHSHRQPSVSSTNSSTSNSSRRRRKKKIQQ